MIINWINYIGTYIYPSGPMYLAVVSKLDNLKSSRCTRTKTIRLKLNLNKLGQAF